MGGQDRECSMSLLLVQLFFEALGIVVTECIYEHNDYHNKQAPANGTIAIWLQAITTTENICTATTIYSVQLKLHAHACMHD